MKNIYVLDFDGTITHADTLPKFIEFAVGRVRFRLSLILFIPLIILMKLKLYPNGRAKERLFSFFFKGMSSERFDNICMAFAATKHSLLRPKAVKFIQEKIKNEEEIVILSASIDRWVAPFFANLPQIKVIGTQIERKNSHLTGLFSTPNCYGEEKVKRLKNAIPQIEHYNIIAFGDSLGDKQLLEYANTAHYKPFRK